MKFAAITAFLLPLVTMVTASGHDPRVKTFRIDNLGESAMLECTERDDVTFQYWLLPDLTIADVDFEDDRIQLLSNWTLSIPWVEQENLGDYICYVDDNGEPVYYKTTLYVYIPGQWELYQMNVTIGLSAAAIFLVLATFLCCFYHWRWEAKAVRKDREEQEPSGISSPEVHAESQNGTKPPLPADGVNGEPDHGAYSEAYNEAYSGPSSYYVKPDDDITQL